MFGSPAVAGDFFRKPINFSRREKLIGPDSTRLGGGTIYLRGFIPNSEELLKEPKCYSNTIALTHPKTLFLVFWVGSEDSEDSEKFFPKSRI